MNAPKRYIEKSPKKFSLSLNFDRKDKVDDATLKKNIASLINYFETSTEVPHSITALVSVKPSLIGYQSKDSLLPRSNDRVTMPSTQNDVLVAAHCESASDLIFVQRVCKNALRDVAEIDEAVSGSKLRYTQEPFGFYHDVREDEKEDASVAIINSGDLKGGSWVLAQRYQQSVHKFYELSRNNRDNVMGAEQIGQTNNNPHYPATAHTQVAKAGSKKPLMLRRGFSYSLQGEEGVFFIGLSENTDFFSQTLNAMMAGDALLDFSSAVTGGVYFAPANGDFLYPNAPKINTPEEAKALILIDEKSGQAWSITDYTTMTVFTDYLNQCRDNGLFIGPIGNMSINPEVQIMLNAIHQVLAGGKIVASPVVSGFDDKIVDKLKELLAQSGDGSNQLNLVAQRYMTLN